MASSSWLYTFFCFSLFFLSPTSATISYTDHCSSTVPESSTTARTYHRTFPSLRTSYLTGGDRLLSRKQGIQDYYYVGKSLRLSVRSKSYQTVSPGVYKVEASLFIQAPYRYYHNDRGSFRYGGSYHRSRARGWIRFLMNGFLSEISRKLCLVGSGSWLVDETNKVLNLDAVLKLSYASENPDIYTGVVSGTLESVSSADDQGYFEPILIFGFPYLEKYNYSLVSQELGEGGFRNFEVSKNQSLSLQQREICSVLSGKSTIYELDYAVGCSAADDHHCSPIGSQTGFWPRFLSLYSIQCSADLRKLRYVATFLNMSYDDQNFRLDSTLIGEASWDDKRNELLMVACRILNPGESHAVGDCNLRLILRYPSIWTIRNDAKILGHLWSNRTVEDSGYFKMINLTSFYDNDALAFPGLEYEYTELERVKKLCPAKKNEEKINKYPDGHSYEMRFDMSIKNSTGEQFAWGYATPLSVENELYQGSTELVAIDSLASYSAPVTATVSEAEINNPTGPLNISYKITIYPFSRTNLRALNWSMYLRRQLEITAEGVYDAKTGGLCMVGCRKLTSFVNNSSYIYRDCEILVKLNFAPLNDRRGGQIKGTIGSTRAKTDALYFEDLSISSAAYYEAVIKRSIWRMDLEITMVLISNTLLCIFVGLQIFHVKGNPEVISCTSLVMLVILSLGQMIPLVLNFEALFLNGIHEKRDLSFGTGKWIEANEVAVRVITMVAFLLQIRLLQVVWAARTKDGNENEKRAWIAQNEAAFVSLALYILGGLLALLFNWMRNNIYQKYSNWGNLRSYAGLILDGFLLPQIILNAFSSSSEKALSCWFYIGTSAIRLVPHAYNQYRAHNYPAYGVDGTYCYANPAADLYSTAWDVIIPCGIIALAVIVFLQQRHGGRWILPRRFRELELYQKVPTVNNDS